MISKNLLLAFGAGVIAGVLGARFYNSHKDEIDDKVSSLYGRVQDAAGLGGAEPQAEAAAQPAPAEAGAAAATAANESELSLAELEAQKERLEDMIAEEKARQNQQGNS